MTQKPIAQQRLAVQVRRPALQRSPGSDLGRAILSPVRGKRRRDVAQHDQMKAGRCGAKQLSPSVAPKHSVSTCLELKDSLHIAPQASHQIRIPRQVCSSVVELQEGTPSYDHHRQVTPEGTCHRDQKRLCGCGQLDCLVGRDSRGANDRASCASGQTLYCCQQQ